MKAALAGLAVVLASSAARADELPPRRGFTGEAGAGLGFMHVADDDAVSFHGTYGGGSPLILSAGAFLTPAVAVRLHATFPTYVWETGTATSIRVLGYVGPEAQVWLRDDVNVGGGAGFALWDPDARHPFGPNQVAGWGFSVFGKWAFARLRHQAIAVGIEVVPAFLSRAPSTVVTSALTLSWQYY